MSLETVCKNCGEEYDTRHGWCPVCTPTRKVVSGMGPREVRVQLWRWNGFYLMTHAPIEGTARGRYRVSEETTGFGIPGSFANTVEEAKLRAKDVLAHYAGKVDAEIKRHPVLNPIVEEDSMAGIG